MQWRSPLRLFFPIRDIRAIRGSSPLFSLPSVCSVISVAKKLLRVPKPEGRHGSAGARFPVGVVAVHAATRAACFQELAEVPIG